MRIRKSSQLWDIFSYFLYIHWNHATIYLIRNKFTSNFRTFKDVIYFKPEYKRHIRAYSFILLGLSIFWIFWWTFWSIWLIFVLFKLGSIAILAANALLFGLRRFYTIAWWALIDFSLMPKFICSRLYGCQRPRTKNVTRSFSRRPFYEHSLKIGITVNLVMVRSSTPSWRRNMRKRWHLGGVNECISCACMPLSISSHSLPPRNS